MAGGGQDRAHALGWGEGFRPNRPKTVARYHTIPQKATNVSIPAAVALGKLGASKGGKARAEKLSDKRKSEIARKAANARWEKWRRERQQEESS
jgi:hypothetical protein